MWILDTDSDFLQGRRMWLKPGQRYLFGRVKRDGVMIAIDHKTVSRQHFNITVDHVKEGDVGNVYTRTRIRVEDHSKTGTFVNEYTENVILKKKDPKDKYEPNPSTELKHAENFIKPGTLPKPFTVTWQPQVFTFNLLKSQIRSGVLKEKQARLQGLDIKATSDFNSERTTHVVASKRNTAKGLQALVYGKYLVTESYLDALEYAATPITLSQDINLSPLESDFDSAWPDAREHLPPPGKEPTIKPPEDYQPDPARTSVFDHYTFVFGDQSQYDSLMPAITGGHGKAILFKVANGETTSDELLQFLRNTAGHKAGSIQGGSSKGGVILVRWTAKDHGDQEWTNMLINETVLKMDQRAIDQSEFLLAILDSDAEILKQSVPFESTNDGIIAPPPSEANSVITSEQKISCMNAGSTTERTSTRASNTPRMTDGAAVAYTDPSQHETQPDQAAEEPVPMPVSGPKILQAAKFRSFNDGFDPDAIAAYDEEDEVFNGESDSPGADIQPFENQTQSSMGKLEPPSTSKKRVRSPTPEPSNVFAEEMDDLLPAATAFKKQKLVEAAVNGSLGDLDQAPSRVAPAKKIKKENVIDVRKAAQKRRREEEEAAKRYEDDDNLLKFEDKIPANLAEVVTVDLPVRDKAKKANSRTDGSRGPDWDPKWNGRKNFKGFRCKGETSQRRAHARKVIVPLEEVPNKSGGLGDRYWSKTEEDLERERDKKRREEARSQRTTQSQTQQRSSASTASRSKGKARAQIISDHEDEADAMDEFGAEDDRDDGIADTTNPATTRLQREAAEIVDHDIELDTPRQTRAAERTQQAIADGSDIEGGNTAQTRNQIQKGKRVASSNVDTSKAKRQKTLPATVVRDENSDDDDDTKFRFGSRARRGRGRGDRALR